MSNESIGQVGQQHGIEDVIATLKDVLSEVERGEWPADGVQGGASFARTEDGMTCVIYLRTMAPDDTKPVKPAALKVLGVQLDGVLSGKVLAVDGVVVAELEEQDSDELLVIAHACAAVVTRRADGGEPLARRLMGLEPVVVPAATSTAGAEQLADADEGVPE